jgi:hypothetical protein
MREFELALCALLAFLFPVAIYCLILATINRRVKPLIVSGVWDSVGLLCAVGGFFLVTVPMLITEFYRRAFTSEDAESFLTLWLQQWTLWLIYYLLLISGSSLMTLWRTHKTSIYNVDTELFAKVLEQTCAALGLAMTANRARLVLTPAPRIELSESTAISVSAPKPLLDPQDRRHAELEIESFPSMCHVTLHWDNYSLEVRRQIEAELDKSLEAAAPLENPATGWLLNISGMIFGALLMVALAAVVVHIFFNR